MIPEFTKEDLMVLADMSDVEFNKGSYTTPSLHKLMEELLSKCKNGDALTFFLAKILAVKAAGDKPLIQRPLEEMPLFINDPSNTRKLLATWRLSVAK